MRTIAALGGSVLAGFVLASPAGAAIVNVNCATQRLQARIDAASPGDTLRIKGTCVGRFTIDKNLTLDGNPRATLDGGELGRSLLVTGSATARLFDLTVTGGYLAGPSAAGAGIFHASGSLTLRRVSVVRNNVVGTAPAPTAGAGIASIGGSLALYDCVLRANSVLVSTVGANTALGGGIYRSGALLVQNTTVADNRAVARSDGNAQAGGAGLYLTGGALRLLGSRVTGNRATADADGATSLALARGGGVELTSAGVLTITGSTLSGNHAVTIGGGTVAIVLGGALDAGASSVTIRDSRLDGNAARVWNNGPGTAQGQGGGIFLAGAPLTMTGSRVTGSRVSAEATGLAEAGGGGISVSNPATVRSTRLAGNRADALSTGGGVSARAGGILATGSLTLDRSTIDANRAFADGPAVADAYGAGATAFGQTTTTSSTISRNVASSTDRSFGGGLFLAGSSGNTISNSTIASNSALAGGATKSGGGLYSSGAVTLTSSTVARNTAAVGGGIFMDSATVTLRGTIVAGNTAPTSADCAGFAVSSGFNLVSKTLGCLLTHLASDKRNVAARLAQLRANGGPTQTIGLLRGSPALNAIPKAQCPTARDQRGVKRPQQTRCEIGAYERKP